RLREVGMIGSLRLLLLPLLVLACSACAQGAPEGAGKAPVLDTGALDGAAYRIDIPANWNHGLVVFYHGYPIPPVQLPARDPSAPHLKQFVDRGYAVIQSAYSAIGWAVEQASADSERLRRQFAAKYGTPRETWALGMSMGGTLTVMALE